MYPYGLCAVVDDPFKDASSARTKVTLYLLHLVLLALSLQLQLHQSPTSFTFPSIVSETRIALVNLSTVMFDVDGTLAKSTSDHEILVD